MNVQMDYYAALYRLWSVIALGEGTAALFEAMDIFDDPTELFRGLSEPDKLPAQIRSRLSPQLTAAAKVPLGKAETVFEECDKKGIMIVPLESPLYPKRLLQLYHPPAVLFVKGDICGIDNRLSISIVGARQASDYSLKVTSAIVRTLAGHGFDIVSGFAEGVDICAHLTAVKSGARTFAVLGTGLDSDYPKPNAKYRDFIAEHGALITEYLPGTKGSSAKFPQRNRILTALSLGTAVIEASAKSGSLNSASHCADLGKPVFAVPPYDLFDSNYYGNSELIRQGAVPLMGARDIYNEYCPWLLHTIDENDPLRREVERLEEECGSLLRGKPAGTVPDGQKIRSGLIRARRKDKAQREAAKAAERNAKETAVNNGSDKADKAAAACVSGMSGGSYENGIVPAGQRENAPLTAVKTAEKFTVPDGLTEVQERTVNVLMQSSRPLRADEIAQSLDSDIDDVLETVTDLELMGIIRTEGSNYKLAKR
ncbi:MAG: DNA-processing protein DprA [Ruminococcus sp.]|nr:DNA-processing protein DprA [Ruminococcus sp.]